MQARNNWRRDYLGISKWHAAGYTGRRGLTASGEDFVNGSTHAKQTYEIFKEVAPDRSVVYVPFASNISKFIADTRIQNIDCVFVSKLGLPLSIRERRQLTEDLNDFTTVLVAAGNHSTENASTYMAPSTIYGVGAVHLEASEILNGVPTLNASVEPVVAYYTSKSDKVDFAGVAGFSLSTNRPFNGTSCATPVLAGMVALVNDFFIDKTGAPLTHQKMYQFLKDCVKDVGAPGKDMFSGWGMPILPDPNSIDIARYATSTEPSISCPAGRSTLADYPGVTVFKLAKSSIETIEFAVCKQPKQTLEQFYSMQSYKPDILCNGGLFNVSDGEPIGTYVSNAVVYSKDPALLQGFGIQDNSLEFGTFANQYPAFLSGYPVLIRNGYPVATNVGKELDYPTDRTVLAYDNDNIYIVTATGTGRTFGELKAILQALGVQFAINLDGGGSTRVLESGKMVVGHVYSRPVDNVIAIYYKKQSSTIYRVQTGAFSNKQNADTYLLTIKSLQDNIGAGYKNAYIRQLDGLYKVQVGAFSIKANAEKVVSDLRSQGYSSFITTR